MCNLSPYLHVHGHRAAQISNRRKKLEWSAFLRPLHISLRPEVIMATSKNRAEYHLFTSTADGIRLALAAAFMSHSHCY